MRNMPLAEGVGYREQARRAYAYDIRGNDPKTVPWLIEYRALLARRWTEQGELTCLDACPRMQVWHLQSGWSTTSADGTCQYSETK